MINVEVSLFFKLLSRLTVDEAKLYCKRFKLAKNVYDMSPSSYRGIVMRWTSSAVRDIDVCVTPSKLRFSTVLFSRLITHVFYFSALAGWEPTAIAASSGQCSSLLQRLMGRYKLPPPVYFSFVFIVWRRCRCTGGMHLRPNKTWAGLAELFGKPLFPLNFCILL